MTSQKGTIRIALLVIVVALVAGLVYLVVARPGANTTPAPTPPVLTEPPIPTDETAGWKTYINSKYGYELKYPSHVGYIGEMAGNFVGDLSDPQSGYWLISNREKTFYIEIEKSDIRIINEEFSTKEGLELAKQILSTFKFLEQTELTKEKALILMKDDLFTECRPERVIGKYAICSVDISKENEQWLVTVTFDGLYDDSVKASRLQAKFRYSDGKWIKSDIIETQQCWPGRGHQDFSAEACI